MGDPDPTAPDHTPPADEFLALDADASQNYAINAAVAGQDLARRGRCSRRIDDVGHREVGRFSRIHLAVAGADPERVDDLRTRGS